MGTEIIEFDHWRKHQLAMVGFVYIAEKKYFFRKRIDKKTDPKTIQLDKGEILATNGNCHLVLTLDHSKANRVSSAIKK